MRRVGFGLALALAGGAATAQPAGYVQNLRNLAQLQSLNAQLLSHDSATGVLQQICDRRTGGKERIKARRIPAREIGGVELVAREQLGARRDEWVVLRRVELSCGGVVLSRADNWYMPNRLTPEMNRQLETTDTPFGVVVRPLDFRRRTLAARLLFQPLPTGWEDQPPVRFAQAAAPPPEVLQHRAVLAEPNGRPFSFLVETYAREVLR